MSDYQIYLDDYEIANLREALLFVQACGSDTGDWLGQILHKLPEVKHIPNVPFQEQKRSLAMRIGWTLMGFGPSRL